MARASPRRVTQAGSYTAAVDLFEHDELRSLAQGIAQAIPANRGQVARAVLQRSPDATPRSPAASSI